MRNFICRTPFFSLVAKGIKVVNNSFPSENENDAFFTLVSSTEKKYNQLFLDVFFSLDFDRNYDDIFNVQNLGLNHHEHATIDFNDASLRLIVGPIIMIIVR